MERDRDKGRDWDKIRDGDRDEDGYEDGDCYWDYPSDTASINRRASQLYSSNILSIM